MMSWTEAFRSISRLFTRSRSADSESEVGEAEAAGSTFTCSVSEDGADQTPEAAAQCSGSTGGHEGVSAAPRAPTTPPAHTHLLQTSRTARTHTPSSTAEPPGGWSQRTHTQSAEDGSEAIDINAKELLEEKRRYDLSCPPVVTYGTYRGLKEVRKPKKKHSIELHSPISEGDEPAHPEQTCCFTVNTMSTDLQESPSVLNQSSPPWTQQIEDVLLTQGVLLAQDPSVESPTLPHPAYSNWSITCRETEPVYRIPQAEPRPAKHLDYTEQEHLDLNAAIETVPANTQSATNTHRPHTTPTPEPEQNSEEVCAVADRTDDQQESETGPAELQCGVEEQLLRVESRLMVDGILTSALSALQEMEDSERGVLLSCELTSESGLIEDNRAADAELRCGMDPSGRASSAVLEPPAGSCALGDYSRSLPSSGYESIAGSDSDIRGFVGAASEVCSAHAAVSSQSENQVHVEHFCEGKSVDPAPCSGCAEIRSVHSHNPEISLHSPASSEESLFQEKHTAEVCMCTESRVDKSQDTVKEHVLSNNNNWRHSTSGSALSADQESLQQSQTLSVTLSDSHSFTSDSGVVSELRAPAVHSHESMQPEAPYSGEQETRGSGEQEHCYSQAAADLSVLLSGAEPRCSAVQPASPPWVSVRAVCYSITDDQSPSPEEHLNPADTGVCVSSLDSLNASISSTAFPQHSRFLDPDPQPDGGFSIISEEDEGDVVFVNDLGALHSPSARRAKAYPFCLSPIYEEECVREEAPGPQEPQEEQRSVEQPAAAILSLLQSVSEKLQSSMGRGSGETWSREDCTRSPQDHQEDMWVLLNHHIHQEDTGAPLILQVLPEPIADPSDDHSTDREQQEPDRDGVKSANTPFYQYMKSGLMQSPDEDTKDVVCGSEANPGVTEKNRVLGKINPRPAAMLIYDGGGEKRRICSDVEDTRTELTAHGATLHALRGCWLLYEDWCYRGPCVLLEEGQSMRTGAGAQQDLKESRRADRTDAVGHVGSVRTLLKDECAPVLHLHLSSSQCLRLCSSTELTEQQGPVCLSDICVRSGCWVVYEHRGFSGASAVLEAGGRVTPVLRESSLSCVRSLRPLKLGGLQVTRPLDPEVLLYARPLLEGQCRAVLEHRACLEEMEAPGSLRVTAGIWVVFSAAGFRGHQCVLEEGEYSDCSRLFSRTDLSIRSLRFLNTDFLEPSVYVKICGQELEVCVEMPDLQDTDSICVKSGVWVAYSESNFSGEQCVLEKGRYTGQLQWGDRRSSPRSLRPIHREVCQTEEPQFLIRLYSELQYGGESREFISAAADCGAAHLRSLRVIRGSWLLFDDYGFSGNQYILSEGLYPDLTSCGCPATAIRSLKPIPHSFSEPCVSVFSLSGFEGLQETWRSAVENTHFISQSVRVTGGQWVAYEFPLFRGRQVLLGPGECAEWAELSDWGTLGSIRPLQQPRGYLQLRNRALGLVLTAEDLPDGSFPAKLLLRSAERSLHTQRWILRDGLLKNTKQMGCLSVIGAKACAGAPVALWEEHGHTNQRWSITEDGHIHTHLDHSLVLDLTGKGQRLVLSPAEDQRSSQIWDIHLL